MDGNKSESAGGMPQRPSLSELEAFHAVITFAKMTAAARYLGISQPAVSHAIASLETRLGRKLFTRDGGLLVPTAEALALDQEAGKIMEALDRMVRSRDGRREPTHIKIIATATLAHHFLAQMLPRFIQEEPGLVPQIEIGTTSDILHAITDRQADLGLMDGPAPHAGLRIEVVKQNVAHVILPANHPLAACSTLDVTALRDEKLIALPHRFPVRTMIDRAFEAAGITPKIVMEAATSAFAAEMVARGVGISILNPFPLMMSPPPTLVSRSFTPAITFDTAVVTSESKSAPDTVRRLVAAMRASFIAQEIKP